MQVKTFPTKLIGTPKFQRMEDLSASVIVFPSTPRDSYFQSVTSETS